jgi:hypothetical protein
MARKVIGGLIQAAAPISDPSVPIEEVKEAAIARHLATSGTPSSTRHIQAGNGRAANRSTAPNHASSAGADAEPVGLSDAQPPGEPVPAARGWGDLVGAARLVRSAAISGLFRFGDLTKSR